MSRFRWSESWVIRAVTQHFYKQPWLVLPKFRPGAGTGQFCEKEFDCFCFHPWTSENYSRHVIEAKIARSDFLKEAKDPLKKRAGLYCSNKFWFAAPAGCILNLDEVPINCGYYKVGGDPDSGLTCELVIPAPELADEPPTWNFLAAAVRRVLTEGEMAKLRDQIAELEKVQYTAPTPEKAKAAKEKARSLRETVAMLGKGKRR